MQFDKISCVGNQNPNTFHVVESIAESTSAPADYMPLVPMTRNWEVSPDSVTVIKVIGKGAFGQVAKAKQGNKLVAVKMLKG